MTTITKTLMTALLMAVGAGNALADKKKTVTEEP